MTHPRTSYAIAPLLAAWFCAAATACGGSSGAANGASQSQGSAAGSGSASASKGPSCALMSLAEVSAALGLTDLQKPTTTVNDIVTLCQYPAGNNPAKVLIRYQTPTTPSEFMLGKDGFGQNGLSTMDVAGLGDAAYSSTLGSGSIEVNSVVFLGKMTEVEISAPVSLDKVEALARAILAKL